jgi:OOP family OmpA-OmpF porin
LTCLTGNGISSEFGSPPFRRTHVRSEEGMGNNRQHRRSAPLAAILLAAAVGAALAFAPARASAQDRLLNLQLFAPAADSRGLITVDRSETLGNLDIAFGLWVNYARNPLVLTPDGMTSAPHPLVSNMVTGDVHFVLGFLGFMEAGVLLPVSILNGPKDTMDVFGVERISVQGIGDPMLKLKAEIVSRRKTGFGVAALLGVRFPVGTNNRDFLTSGGFELAPRVIADTNAGSRFKLSLNVGANLRFSNQAMDCCAGAAATSTFAVGHELTFGLGAALVLVEERLDLVLEGTGHLGLSGRGPFITRAPVEAILGLKVFIARNSFLVLGASYGVTRFAGESYGSPEPRAFVGITYEPSIGDKDGDGYKDNVDACPLDPEDFDGFEDKDGCPEPDNDGDGVLDVDDDCPLVPGPVENKGCPMAVKRGDRDGDGIYDDVDKCPDDPEDYDKFEDTDGCPEPDNDGDGILDKDDQCPNDPEDKDGWEDADGCPEPDNDGDGILDKDDACPNEPETKNGYEDEDGCPDEKKRVKIVKGKILILEKIYFEYDKAVIKKESYGILYEVAKTMNENPQILLVRVEGHTDSDGGDDYNLKLSDARAHSVRDFLVKKGGVAGDRLEAKGYGETKPIADNSTDEGKATNRRVEFIIVKEEGVDSTP